jgi:hypothetical protein
MIGRTSSAGLSSGPSRYIHVPKNRLPKSVGRVIAKPFRFPGTDHDSIRCIGHAIWLPVARIDGPIPV